MIHIDSSIRDYRTYTKSSDFQITVNAKPSENDVRYQSKIRTDIEYLFQWVGNSEFNNPISKVIKDVHKLILLPKSLVGGRNFSSVNDLLTETNLKRLKQKNNDFYRLRRSANNI